MRALAPLRLLSTYPVPMGIVVAALLVPAHFVLPKSTSVVFAAVTLEVIAALYLGFALRDGSRQAWVTESIGFAVYTLAAIIGLNGYAFVIPLAIMAHAGWDILHRNGDFGAALPSWYPPFCAVIDILAGGTLLLLFLRY